MPTTPVITRIALGATSYSLSVGEGGVWVRTIDGHVLRIDPGTNRVVATIKIPDGEFGNVAAGAGGVWVTNFDDNSVSRIDPASNEVTATIAVGRNPEGITVTADAVWISNHRGGSISRIDPESNEVVATITLVPPGASGPKGIVIAGRRLWTNVPNALAVFGINPNTNAAVTKLSLALVDGVTSDGRSLFVLSRDEILEIDPKTNETLRSFDPPLWAEAYGRSAFWTADCGVLWRVDPQTFDPVAGWQVSDSEAGAAIELAEDSLWLLFGDDRELARVDL